MKVFSGLGMEYLTDEVCHLLGVHPGKLFIKKFSDGEMRPQILESVHDETVFLIQSMYSSDSIIALFLTISAIREAWAGQIIPVIPYYGYGRQDCKDRPRVPISAALWARFI